MAPAVKTNKKLVQAIAKWRADPSLFVKSLMGVTPDQNQTDILAALARGDRHIAIKSGHGVGKSTVLSWAAVWWITCAEIGAKVRITAPTSTQLHDTLLAEMKAGINKMPAPMREELYHVTADRVEFKPFPHDNFISAVTSRADQPDAMHGVHAKAVLIIGDEASGIPDPVYESSVGSMSSQRACMLLAGNPVRNKGFFYDCFTKPGVTEKWTKFTISCVGHPRITPDFIEEQRARYGEDSNAFRIRVLGEFPRGDDDAVIPMHLILSAVDRPVEIVGNVVWGLDVAAFGPNVTALAKRKGNGLLGPVRCWKGLDAMQVVGAIQQEWEVTPFVDRPYEILVDALGPGSGVASRLRELKLPARGINVSEAPAMKGRYANLRSELWYKCREWFEKRDCTIPRDEDLIADLAMPTYRFTPGTGKIFVQGKATRLEDFKGMTRSPDRGDALCLTFASNAATALLGAASPDEPIRRNIRGTV